MAFDSNRRADVFLTVESASGKVPFPHGERSSTPQPHFKSDYEIMAEQLRDEPRNTLSCLVALLEVPRWMTGLWQSVELTKGVFQRIPGGWLNNRSGAPVFVSFAEARQWIENRIVELGLDADLVNAWPHSHHSVSEDSAFYKLPFEVRMNCFRARTDVKATLTQE